MKMKKWFLSATAAATLFGLAACNNTDNQVLVETSAGDITQNEFYEKLKDQYGEMVIYEMVLTKVLEAKYEVTEEEVDAELESLKEQYGDQFEFFLSANGVSDEEALKDTLHLQLIQDKALASYIEIPEEDMQARYDEMKPEIKASHILIKDESVAKDVLERVRNGEDFAELATEYSEDPGSVQTGGDLGYFGPGMMTPSFEEAAYALEVNEISDLVESEFGYHIIKVTDRKELEPFEDMKEDIRKELIQQKVQEDPAAVQEHIKNELVEADIKVNDEDLSGIFELITAPTPKAPVEEGTDTETDEDK